jgi:hypothetical protein
MFQIFEVHLNSKVEKMKPEGLGGRPKYSPAPELLRDAWHGKFQSRRNVTSRGSIIVTLHSQGFQLHELNHIVPGVVFQTGMFKTSQLQRCRLYRTTSRGAYSGE